MRQAETGLALGPICEALLEIDPKDVSARLKLGKLLLLAGSSDEALSLANAGIQLDDRNANLHALKAAVFSQTEQAFGIGP